MAKPSLHHGVLVVDKPKGPTSHDVVARVRKVFGTREVGHAGTLDPMATGVLVVAVGEATKLVPYLTADDKAYETTIALGATTDTLDAEGTVTDRVPVPGALASELGEAGGASALFAAALDAERARTIQVPPAFSAIRVNGERAHVLARRGDAPVLEPRPVAVRRIDVLGADSAEVKLALAVGKGYFVRSLARDLTAALGTVGHLTALRRTRSGAFAIADAVALERATPDALVSMSEAAARTLPVTVLDEAGVRAARFGQAIPAESLRGEATRGPSAFLDEAGELVAIGERGEDGRGRVLRGFSRSAERDG